MKRRQQTVEKERQQAAVFLHLDDIVERATVALIEEAGSDIVTESLLGCFEAEVVLTDCIVALGCEDYTNYYYSEEETDVCTAELEAHEVACAEFFSD